MNQNQLQGIMTNVEIIRQFELPGGLGPKFRAEEEAKRAAIQKEAAKYPPLTFYFCGKIKKHGWRQGFLDLRNVPYPLIPRDPLIRPAFEPETLPVEATGADLPPVVAGRLTPDGLRARFELSKQLHEALWGGFRGSQLLTQAVAYR